MDRIFIQFSQDVDVETIKNFNRFYSLIITKTNRPRFPATDLERDIKSKLCKLMLWDLSPVKLLHLVGPDLLAWNLEEPQYPDNYLFTCLPYSTMSKDKFNETIKTIFKEVRFVEAVFTNANFPSI